MKGGFGFGLRTVRSRSRRGSILLMVLVLIVVVSFALTMFIEKAEVEIKSEGYFVKRSELRREAWSMLEVAVAVLADVKAIDSALYAPSQGWGDPLDYAGIEPRDGLEVSYRFVDESGKVNLNALDRDSLILLFDELDFDLDISSRLSDVLLDWIDGDDETRIEGAESEEYSSLELDVHPANQPLKSLEELKYLVDFEEFFFDENGLPLPVFEELQAAATVQEVGTLNVNSASSLALRAMADLDEYDKQAIDDFREGLDGELGTADDNYFGNSDDVAAVLVDIPEGAPLGHQISVLTLEVTVREGGYSYTLVGTMSATSEAPSLEQSGVSLRYPFQFLDLRELPGVDNARPL